MSTYPSGTITFLFTDIEGSTRLWEQGPEAMKPTVLRHNEILRTAIESNGGQVFRIVGDGMFAAFTYAPQAVKAAVQAQRDLFREDWKTTSPIRVRMALHTGAAEYHHDDYMGASLNHLGRLLPAGHGGQILLTGATEELVHDLLPEDTSLCDLGQHRFRDLPRPEHIFQVDILDLPHEFPPVKSSIVSPNNLPTPVTSFIGRSKELAEVKSLLVRSRLLTLTGPGGTGKTRLSLQTGIDILDVFPDGVWLVELASLADPVLILKSIAAVLHVRELPNLQLQDLLAEALHPKETLIILDNCEHLIEQVAVVVDKLLNICPHLHVMVSSREPLGISGEAVFRVPSLSLPPLESVSHEEIEGYESVRLFIERATAVNPLFSLTSQNAPAIAQICRRLDGIPLAIELAAARTKLLSAEQIAARLDDRFRLLTGGSRTALPRQQTLRALIDWSYDLLSEPERDLLRQLSIFTGGWTLEAAEAICQVDEGDVLDLLEQLVNKSLVIPDQRESEVRYHMLETIRQYAQEKLFETGQVEPVRDRYLDCYAKLAGQAGLGIEGPENMTWIKRLVSEHDNFRSALKWGLDRNLLQAAQIATNLPFFWSRRGFSSEGIDWLEAILRRLPEEEGQLPSKDYLLNQGRILSSLAMIRLTTGEYQQSAAEFQQSIELFQKIGDIADISLPYSLLGLLLNFAGDFPTARRYAQEALRLAEMNGNEMRIGLSLNVLGQIEVYQEDGDLSLAQSYLDRSLSSLDKLGTSWFNSASRQGLALLAIKKGDLVTAKKHLTEGMQSAQALGDRPFMNVARDGLAKVACLEKRYSEAIRLYQETAKEWNRLANRGAVARCMESISFVFIEEAQADPNHNQDLIVLSAKLMGAAETIRSSYSTSMMKSEQKEFEQYLETLRKLGSETMISNAWNEGKKMSYDEAVNFVLNLPNHILIDKLIKHL